MLINFHLTSKESISAALWVELRFATIMVGNSLA